MLEDGRITQQGTHAELIQRQGLYRRIAEIQDGRLGRRRSIMYIEEQDFAAKKIDWNVWKKLYRYALQHKKLFFSVIAALVVVAVIDIAYPLFTSYAIDHYVVPKSTERGSADLRCSTSP